MKKKAERKKITIDSLFIGDEPTWGNPKTELSLIRALNWYSNNLSPKESKKFTLDYVKFKKFPKEIVEKLSSAQDYCFKNLGFICRIVQRGGSINNDVLIEEKIQNIINYIPSSNIFVDDSQQAVQKPEKNIQERMFDQATTYINEIEGHVDSFIKEKKSEFKCYEWLVANSIKPIYLSQIKDHYQPFFVEISEAINKEDDQLVESYAHWSKKELSEYLKFIGGIISDCDKYSNNTKTVRKTRKKKAVPLEKKVSKVKYKKEDTEYKIVSVNPTEIIASSQVWVFNSKTKSLGVYYSNDDSGFSIKGTTIEGFNETSSIQKTLRKPQDILPLITKGKKTELKKVMKELSTKEKPLNGRLNEEIIILKVVK